MNINKLPFFKLNEFRQFIKFCVVGTIAAAINFFILYSFTEWLNLWYVISALSGGIISAIWNFLANKFWTFKNLESGKKAVRQTIKFSIVISLGVGLNTMIIYIFTDFFGVDYRISWVLATGIVLFWNFGLNKLWTFRTQEKING